MVRPRTTAERTCWRVSTRRRQWCLVAVVSVLGLASAECDAKRPFTVQDDIALTQFGDPGTGKAEPLLHSPDGAYVVVTAVRGRLDLNRVESTLRVYLTRDLRTFLRNPMIARPPPPKWAIRKSTNKTGPIITEVHWVQNSTGFGFLSKTASGNRQLHLVDLKASRCYALTSPDQDVTSFDIRDRSHFVYTALSPSIHSRAAAARA